MLVYSTDLIVVGDTVLRTFSLSFFPAGHPLTGKAADGHG
jgi:hypothetical protein